MNNYGDRAMSHKRVRMDGEGGAGVVQGNGIPLNYMDNGHQIAYQPYGGAYNHYSAADVAFSSYAGGELANYAAARGLAYAPPAHQAYQPAFVQQQQQMLYEQHHHHQHKPAWPAMQALQNSQSVGDHHLKGDMTVKKEIKVEPSASDPKPLSMRINEPHPMSSSSPGAPPVPPTSAGAPAGTEDPPKIKIKTDLFKEGEVAKARQDTAPATNNADRASSVKTEENVQKTPVVAAGAPAVPPTPTIVPVPAAPTTPDKTIDGELEVAKARQLLANLNESDDKNKEEDASGSTTTNDGAGEAGGAEGDAEAAKSRISDSGNSTDSANKAKFQADSDSSPSSGEDETKIPNDVYFGTPDSAAWRANNPGAPPPAGAAAGTVGGVKTETPSRPPAATNPTEGKKRGRPKGSTNKPKPPELLAQKYNTPKGPVGRPRGGGHSGSYMSHAVRPFKRDFSGVRFRRRYSDDGLDSSHIPNEVYFGDVPVPMEVLYNYYDSHADREKAQAQVAGQAGNVTLVYSSSDSSSDDSSDSDSSDSDPDPNQDPSEAHKRRPGRPRGSKTLNRRSDGQRTPSSAATSPGEKPPGITDMKKFLKIAGIEYDYNKLVDGCTSNRERVGKLMELLRQKGLEGAPSVEACRALYSGPPPRRRGPKPGSVRKPRKERSPKLEPKKEGEEGDGDAEKLKTPKNSKSAEERRVTRGQTSGKPRQRIVISSDEEESLTPLSKLRLMR